MSALSLISVLASEPKASWLGSMRESAEVSDDIVGPIEAFDKWKVRR